MTLYIALIALGLAAYAINEFVVTRDLRPIKPGRQRPKVGATQPVQAAARRFSPIPTGTHLAANVPTEADPVSLTRKLILSRPAHA